MHGPSFQQTLIPFPQGSYMPGLVEIGSEVLRRRWKYERITTTPSDNGQILFGKANLKWAKIPHLIII